MKKKRKNLPRVGGISQGDQELGYRSSGSECFHVPGPTVSGSHYRHGHSCFQQPLDHYSCCLISGHCPFHSWILESPKLWLQAIPRDHFASLTEAEWALERSYHRYELGFTGIRVVYLGLGPALPPRSYCSAGSKFTESTNPGPLERGLGSLKSPSQLSSLWNSCPALPSVEVSFPSRVFHRPECYTGSKHYMSKREPINAVPH